MKTLYESLLDDEEELLDKVDINLFDKLDNSKTMVEYQKFIDILLDSCEKINFKQIALDDEKYDKMAKDTTSFYICVLNDKDSNKTLYINRLFNKSSKYFVRFGPINMRFNNVYIIQTWLGKIEGGSALMHFASKSQIPEFIYKIPKKLMSVFDKWYDRKFEGSGKRLKKLI